jgi:hypothetical protein
MTICKICEKIKETFKMKKADWIIIASIIVILVALILVATGSNKFLSKSPILEEKDIQFSVFFRGITITDTESPFKINEDSFITIRNVPYTKLKITNVKGDRRKVLLQTNKMGNYQPIDDISQPFVYDFIVTVQDKAKITEDGAVVGGNKIKMGIPVILEGKNYKFTGVVSNIQYVNTEEENKQAEESSNVAEQEKDTKK